MVPPRVQPLIVGRGAAGMALRHALALYPDAVAPAAWHPREAPLSVPSDPERALIVVASPHALHTPRLREAAERGYRFAICEKPAAVDLSQVEALAGLPMATWICHGYRLLWGPQELRRAVADGRFGTLVSIEGRYWQSSATRASGGDSWKDTPALSGAYDVLLDLATHWVDLVTCLCGRLPDATSVRRWFVNAGAPHRETHVHVTMQFGDLVSFGSVSKTVHGAGNMLEVALVGERASARWSFERPDVIVWGSGGSCSTQVRSERELPARPAPFHGLGWMEGYGRLVGEVVARMQEREMR
ncbi:MAG: Gfo/Idh/MocA family oxidoreductase, partial [Gemmatimonadota bacterium]|nr:Gfo/Idh/MocA family oxidoreductase [Gemmatimonadota bacterium]